MRATVSSPANERLKAEASSMEAGDSNTTTWKFNLYSIKVQFGPGEMLSPPHAAPEAHGSHFRQETFVVRDDKAELDMDVCLCVCVWALTW